jgi:hypothetical protein
MGDLTLGALLGANQSFDESDLSPWLKVSDQASAFRVDSAAAVHSSTGALFAVVSSTGGALPVIAYAYGSPADAGRAAYPDIGSHTVKSWAWARAADLPSSGQAVWRLDGGQEGVSLPIGTAPAPARYEALTWTDCPAGLLTAGLRRIAGAGPAAAFTVDDVLTQMDPLALHPEWSAEDQAALLRAQHRTQTGQLQTVLWGRYFAWTLPLRALNGLEAGLIRWWWESQLPLALTLDSSDAAAVFVCRITNSRQPIGRRVRPYADRWTGTLTLESLDGGSLVF